MAEIIRLVIPKKVRDTKPRTIYRITEPMYLALLEVRDAEKTGHGMYVTDMPMRMWKALSTRGLIASYEQPVYCVPRLCLTPPGKNAIALFSTPSGSGERS